jgi:hypothetical protein
MAYVVQALAQMTQPDLSHRVPLAQTMAQGMTQMTQTMAHAGEDQRGAVRRYRGAHQGCG